MRKEREDALNDQEAKLGAMLAQLQLDKAKEVTIGALDRTETRCKLYFQLNTII